MRRAHGGKTRQGATAMSLSMISEAASQPAPPHHLAKQLLGLRGRGSGVVPWSCLFLPYFSSNTRPPARVWVPPQPLPLPSHPTDDNAISTKSSSTTNALHIAWHVAGFERAFPSPPPLHRRGWPCSCPFLPPGDALLAMVPVRFRPQNPNNNPAQTYSSLRTGEFRVVLLVS